MAFYHLKSCDTLGAMFNPVREGLLLTSVIEMAQRRSLEEGGLGGREMEEDLECDWTDSKPVGQMSPLLVEPFVGSHILIFFSAP